MSSYNDSVQGRRRIRGLQIFLFACGALIATRLVALQVLEHGHYSVLAAGEHQRKYEVPAIRGQIYIQDHDSQVPLALNLALKLLYADPSVIVDKDATANKLASVTGDPASKYLDALKKGKEYAILKTRVDEQTATKIKALNLRGVGLTSQNYRTYPEGDLASQLLGFVNQDGNGQYGVEGYLNDELKGKAGLLNAKTDTNGVPIATTENINHPPTDGTNLVLTIDRSIQAQAERFLREGVQNVRAESGSLIVLDPTTGAVKAMANYPTFDPNDYTRVSDYSVFQNGVVANQFEPGSGFKVITMSAGLDAGKVKPDTTYNDTTGCYEVSKHQMCNADNHKGGPNTTMTNVIRDSLNTGVIFVLRNLGSDPNKITSAAKKSLHKYITKHFGFGVRTGVEQAGEASGVVNPPTSNDTNYANMTFGQGLSVTMMQMTTAVAAIANGGKMYQPYLVDSRQTADGKKRQARPRVISEHVISTQAATDMTKMMQTVVEHGSGWQAKTPGYNIAGKTGTAQIPNPKGVGYLDNQNIGTFVGFAPVEAPKFVVMVRINKPKTPGFAEKTTVPVFTNMTRWLLQYYAVPPSG